MLSVHSNSSNNLSNVRSFKKRLAEDIVNKYHRSTSLHYLDSKYFETKESADNPNKDFFLDDTFGPNKYQRSTSLYNVDDKKYKAASADEFDNPTEGLDDSLLKTMRYEINRLNSFTGKWPLTYVKPEDLAKNGFFYLQSEDRVQCGFCQVIIDDWNVGQKPHREHIAKSPRCPFLLTSNAGNIRIVQKQALSRVSTVGSDLMKYSDYTPKRPKMSDFQKRLMTYVNFPLAINTQHLAKCGFYYTGVSDVVTCFFCDGSLGNWELDDDPWIEHAKFFPQCPYPEVVKSRAGTDRQWFAPVRQLLKIPQPVVSAAKANAPNPVVMKFIEEASNIFPKALLEKVVSQHPQQFSTLSDLCEAALEYSEKENATGVSYDVTGHTDVTPSKSKLEDYKLCSDPGEVACASSSTDEEETSPTKGKEILLCKICMDREMGVVFQPCGHLLACPKCAQVIYNCPICRKPITSKVRTYVG